MRTAILFQESFIIRIIAVIFFLVTMLLFTPAVTAQDEPEEADEEMAEATIKLSFSQTDTTRTCTAVVMSDTMPVTETDVHFYVKRHFSLLPIDKAVETDENGVASVEFPLDLPGDKDGKLIVIARIEEDDTYGTVEVTDEVKWGVIPSSIIEHWGERSLSASRDMAPTYLIVVSNLIIALIWGIIFYVIFQIYRIKNSRRPITNSNK